MIRIAVIGAGQWGPNLIRNLHDRQSTEVSWVVDLDLGRLREVQARFPEIHVGQDAAAAVSDPGTDAVVIATPTSTHHGLAKLALERKKHVLVEKPLTAEVAQAEELCRLATAADRVLMVGHVFLFNPGVQHVKELLAAGSLGRIYYVSMERTNLGPIRADVDAAWDLAAHDVSIANYWLDAEPVSVSAVGGSWINPGIADAVFATLRYPHDVLVHLHVSWLNPRKTRDITLVGEQRMLTFDDMNLNEPVRIYDKGVTDQRGPAPYADTFTSFRASVRDGDVLIPRIRLGEPLRTECWHFCDCVASGRRPLSGGPEGLAVVRVLAALTRSARAGGREEAVRRG